MSGFDLTAKHQWRPLAAWGIEHPFFSLESDTIIFSWIALALIALLAFLGRISLLHYPQSVPGYIVKSYIRTFSNVIQQTGVQQEAIRQQFITFFTTLFTWLIVCNCIIILPFMEEPTKDLNTTLSLALVTFCYIQYAAMRQHGFLQHANEFFKTPLSIRNVYQPGNLLSLINLAFRIVANTCIGFILLPIELMGKCSNIISLAFRLFGNIFAGAIIASLWFYARSGSIIIQLFGLPLTLLITLFFGIFEGAVQAFVFTMLSVSYLSRALQHHE